MTRLILIHEYKARGDRTTAANWDLRKMMQTPEFDVMGKKKPDEGEALRPGMQSTASLRWHDADINGHRAGAVDANLIQYVQVRCEECSGKRAEE